MLVACCWFEREEQESVCFYLGKAKVAIGASIIILIGAPGFIFIGPPVANSNIALVNCCCWLTA
jgi:hypothetical protein